jgi:tellurite resistance protein
MTDLIVESVLRGVLGGKTRKKSTKALRYLTGQRGGTFVNANTLLTAAGVAWGIYETMQMPQPSEGMPPAGAGVPPAGAGLSTSAAATVDPAKREREGGKTGPYSEPHAAASGGAQPTTLPPLPTLGGDPIDDRTRMIRLAVSAANADGTLHDQERAAILKHAGPEAADVVATELAARRPLAEIVAGVADQAQRATLYVLAYTILRADEQVSGAERIYLAQLANLLGLDPATVRALEHDTNTRIDEGGSPPQRAEERASGTPG